MSCSFYSYFNIFIIHDEYSISRGYEMPPSPQRERLQAASRQYFQGIRMHLQSKSIAPIYIHMDLDIWRYITQGKGRESGHKGYRLYSIEDMSRMQLPDQWWYTLNTYGEGYAIRPPLKMKRVLSWTPKHQIVKNGKLTHGPQNAH